MSWFRKLDEVQSRIDAFPEGESAFGFVFDDVVSATRAISGGREIILAGANNYLGLNHHPEVVAACADATLKMGLGTAGSRLANGTYSCHDRLERELAAFFGCRQAIVFSTGYQANLGVLSSLGGPETVFVVDSESHASILDGCRLGGGRIRRFGHNDVASLERKLRSTKADCKIVVAEGIYSMSGDVAPLREIVDIAGAAGALVVLDEAHSVGVLGEKGRGLAEALGVEQSIDVIVGTFSKSLGAIGGFAVSRHSQLRNLKFAARPYIFSASLPPGVVQGVRAGLRLIGHDPSLRLRLASNIAKLGDSFRALGLPAGHPDVPIFALQMQSVEQAFGVWRVLMEKSVYTNLVVPPASPNNLAMLRLSVSAAHTDDEIAMIGNALRFALRAG